MRRHSVLQITAQKALIFAVCLFLNTCRNQASRSAPTVTFDKIPIADVGGPNKLDTIEGRATGVQAGERIVLYAKSEEQWWIQPYAERQYTEVLKDSRWSNQTHLGTEYAAVLINQEYKPPRTTEELPAVGGGVVTVAIVKGRGSTPDAPPVKTIHFSGYDWKVHVGGGSRGGSRVSFGVENAWTDDRGALHLRISRQENDWECGEIKLARSLGYGTYRFTVSNISRMEPSAVLTLFTWDGVGTEDNRRELDIEISRWGIPDNNNAQYVVQPYYIPANIVRFRAPAGILTQSVEWKPGSATFTTTTGSDDPAKERVIQQHVFTAGVPTPNGHTVRMNLYVFLKGQNPLKNDTEAIINRFEYLP
jgi:hypothetical protein